MCTERKGGGGAVAHQKLYCGLMSSRHAKHGQAHYKINRNFLIMPSEFDIKVLPAVAVLVVTYLVFICVRSACFAGCAVSAGPQPLCRQAHPQKSKEVYTMGLPAEREFAARQERPQQRYDYNAVENKQGIQQHAGSSHLRRVKSRNARLNGMVA